MAVHMRCSGCNQDTPRHCESRACPWTVCPLHGNRRLTAAQRLLLEGRNDATDR